ncbi:MAG: TrkA family potassium uptake protein, partial [Leptospiraceae bacterium]|nr:TrkA family potassium uptake protein [Leptospiraceae bacterium]
EGHEVVAIDKNEEVIHEIRNDSTNAICLDSTEEDALKSQGLDEMDFVVLAVADDFETLIITADILKRIGVREIHARYQTDLHIRILKMLGITNIFNPEENAAKNMGEQFGYSNIKGNTIISDEYRISDIIVPDFFVGKTVEEVGLKENYGLLLVTIKRYRVNSQAKRKSDDMILEVLGIPLATTPFRSKDIISVFGKHEDVEYFLENIR